MKWKFYREAGGKTFLVSEGDNLKNTPSLDADNVLVIEIGGVYFSFSVSEWGAQCVKTGFPTDDGPDPVIKALEEFERNKVVLKCPMCDRTATLATIAGAGVVVCPKCDLEMKVQPKDANDAKAN